MAKELEKPAEATAVAKQPVQKNIVDSVMARINAMQQDGELHLPENYSAPNALKAAYLQLSGMQTRDNKPILTFCSPESISRSLLKMVCEGLTPLKQQGYFIAYGTDLQWMRSYMGSIALAKRVADVKEVIANVVYIGDTFEYTINQHGRKEISLHLQELENIDDTKIRGAYCYVLYNDGRVDVDLMNIAQIKKSWGQGATKGGSGAHTNFTGEMAKRTVINRALKLPINSSDDSHLIIPDADNDGLDPVQVTAHEEIETKANGTVIGFEQPVPESEPKGLDKSTGELLLTDEAPFK